MGFRRREMLFLGGMMVTMVIVNALGGGGVHPAAGNPHPAAGNPHPANFGNPHPAASLPSAHAGFGGARGASRGQDAVTPSAGTGPAQPEMDISFTFVGGQRRGGKGGGFSPVITGFSPNPVTGFTPNPVKGFVPEPTPQRFVNVNPFLKPCQPTGFAGGLSPFPTWPGFTPSVPGPMVKDLRDLLVNERGVKISRLRRVRPIGGNPVEAGTALVTNQTLNTAAPRSAF